MATNESVVTLKLKRIELCDLLMACWAADKVSEGAEKWMTLHDKLDEILKDFDEKNAD